MQISDSGGWRGGKCPYCGNIIFTEYDKHVINCKRIREKYYFQ